MPRPIKEGMILAEMLGVLFLLTALSLLVCDLKSEAVYEHYFFMDELQQAQAQCLHKREKQTVIRDGICIGVNASGNIDHPGTYDFPDHQVIVHLGNGSLRYE